MHGKLFSLFLLTGGTFKLRIILTTSILQIAVVNFIFQQKKVVSSISMEEHFSSSFLVFSFSFFFFIFFLFSPPIGDWSPTSCKKFGDLILIFVICFLSVLQIYLLCEQQTKTKLPRLWVHFCFELLGLLGSFGSLSWKRLETLLSEGFGFCFIPNTSYCVCRVLILKW